MGNRFTAVFEQVDDWWIGYIEELPGANTQGKTLEEVRENLKEAIQLAIEANRELARRFAEISAFQNRDTPLHSAALAAMLMPNSPGLRLAQNDAQSRYRHHQL